MLLAENGGVVIRGGAQTVGSSVSCRSESMVRVYGCTDAGTGVLLGGMNAGCGVERRAYQFSPDIVVLLRRSRVRTSRGGKGRKSPSHDKEGATDG